MIQQQISVNHMVAAGPTVPVGEGQLPVSRSRLRKCPRCQSSTTRSRVRWYERVVRVFTPKRPHRCRLCHWRGWLA